MSQHQRFQIINAPDRPNIVTGEKAIFLAGNTSGATRGWRDTLIGRVSHLPLTVLNPLRADWDGSWSEDVDFHPFKEQVEWEIEMQGSADLVVVHFPDAKGALAPVSLLELGMRAGSGKKCVVICPKGYEKSGNVLLVCKRFGIEVMETLEDVVPYVCDWYLACSRD